MHYVPYFDELKLYIFLYRSQTKSSTAMSAIYHFKAQIDCYFVHTQRSHQPKLNAISVTRMECWEAILRVS